MSGLAEAALRRNRAVTLLALAVLTILAWVWLLLGAGMGMEPQAALDFFPHRTVGGAMELDMGPAMASAPWSPANLTLVFSIWWVMMVAMMLPAAAPVILLYARAAPRHDSLAAPPIGHFLAGYLAIWGLFSALAALLQVGLEQLRFISGMTMGSSGKWLAAALLIAAGLYQLSPLKQACLDHCRNPAVFLSRNYRQGRSGALTMGARHGAFCVGCCWMLMALLFVGGVMNLAWIALLTLLVAAEKLLPGGRRIAFAAGFGCIAWGAITAFA